MTRTVSIKLVHYVNDLGLRGLKFRRSTRTGTRRIRNILRAAVQEGSKSNWDSGEHSSGDIIRTSRSTEVRRIRFNWRTLPSRVRTCGL